jgi:hypothetical protein
VIAADRITIDGNEAWWVPPWTQASLPPIANLNRPCETCDETSYVQGEEFVRCDCIDGRHTFDIEVGRPFWLADPPTPRSRTYRAAIIEVLPIFGENHDDWPSPHPPGPAYVRLNDSGRAFLLTPFESHEITLPSAAAPGMYAVRLAVRP